MIRGLLLLLLLLLIGGLLRVAMLRVRKQQARLHARLTAAAAPYRRVNRLAVMGRGRSLATGPLFRQLLRLGLLFGYHPARRDQYPVRWWILLPGMLAAVLAVFGFVAGNFGSALWVGAAPAWVLLCRSCFGWSEGRRRDALFRQFPDVLAMIVRAVRVGVPVAEGIRTAAHESPQPSAEEFNRVADQLAIGIAIEAALRDMAERTEMAEYRFFATALALQAQTGGSLTETLENLADVIRKRLAVRARAHAMAAEARASIFILAGLPFVAGTGLAVLNPGYIRVLFFDPAGQHVLILALGMLGCGLLVMQTMIKRSLS